MNITVLVILGTLSLGMVMCGLVMSLLPSLYCVDCGFWLGRYRCERCQTRLCDVCSDFPGPRLYPPGKGFCNACRERSRYESAIMLQSKAMRSLPLPQSITSDVVVAEESEFRYDEQVWVTEGIHRGMYGHVRSGPIGDKYLVCFPEQGEKPYTSAWYDVKYLTLNQLLISMGEEPVQNGGQSNRALLRLMKTMEQESEERDPPQCEEMQFAPPDWEDPYKDFLTDEEMDKILEL